MQSVKNILHLNAYYIDNKLYSVLFSELSSMYSQVVYIPIKQNRSEDNKEYIKGCSLYFSKIIKPKHKLFYFSKIKKLTEDLIGKNLIKNIDIIHAHNLFTDGAIALYLKMKYNLDYIVAIRTTDIRLQYKFMVHRRPFARKILKHAKEIIFISEIYKEDFCKLLPMNFLKKIETKLKIIPNGIDRYWFANINNSKIKKTGQISQLIYVGQIIKRKNVLKLIDAVDLLNRDKLHYKLTIIGGENKDEKKYYSKFLKKIRRYDWIDYRGKILDKQIILNFLRLSDIFVMPSKNELFGITYIEAMTQCLPILYSHGEGIEGYIGTHMIGEGVIPSDKESIAEGIRRINAKIEQYKELLEFSKKFDWSKIVGEYKILYENE